MIQTLYLLISLVIVISDQLLKSYIVTHLAVGQTQALIPGILSLTYLKNNGAAWNVLSGQMLFFYLLSIIAIGFCLYFLFSRKFRKPLFSIGLSILLGGIIGNLLDRLHLKYVIDMLQLDFVNFNIFNIADSAITVGVIIIFIYLLFFDSKENK